ncbi:MAG TPA: LLM class flavin-dependent oxidoreductase [Actinoplanes sp.]|jgi:alkanesulfonate monooxygenase SsuD/methylene tetrahydromethanopterin reductase-like flavin-dependent oxidoreductase (luciferase family)
MTTLGAISLPQNPPEALRGIARAADEAGLEELWLWEDCFLGGGVSAAAAALAWTTRLKVGVGIMPVPFRNVALCAMEIAALTRMFGDRVLPGIGHGVQEWMGQVGARPASPLTLLREYATTLRSLLHGESVSVQGKYVRLDAVRLDWPPTPPPALYVAAGGPKTLALAGAIGDGTVLSGGTSPDAVAEASKRIAAAVPHEIVVFVLAVTGPDAADRLATAAVNYQQDYSGLAGTATEIAAGVREFAAAGATKVILQPPPDEPDPEEYVRFVAREVRPLVD